MRCYKVVWRELGGKFRSCFFPEVEYIVGTEYDGVYFAFKDFKPALNYANEFMTYFPPASSLFDITVVRCVGIPIEPQPKRVPALYAPLEFLEQWRATVIESPQTADAMFETSPFFYWFYETDPTWIILRKFVIVAVETVIQPQSRIKLTNTKKGGDYNGSNKEWKCFCNISQSERI